MASCVRADVRHREMLHWKMARTLLHHAGRVLGIGRLAVTLTFTCACGHRRSVRGSISSPVHKACNAAKAANHVRCVLGGGAEQVSSTMDSITLSLSLSLSLALSQCPASATPVSDEGRQCVTTVEYTVQLTLSLFIFCR